MSHPKDDPKDVMDERRPKPGDLLLVDLLYGELSDDAREQAADTLKQDALEPDLAALTNLRALFRQLPDEEPPASVTTKLLHAAALQAATVQSGRESGAASQTPGLWAWFSRLFRPVLMYPGLAAAASLVLVVLVGGTMYMAGKANVTEPELIAPEPIAPEPIAPEPTTPAADTPAATASTTALSTDPLAKDPDSPEEPRLANLDGLLADQTAELATPSGTTRFRGLEQEKGSKRAKRSMSSGSSRTARMYEGDLIAPDDPADGLDIGSAAGAGAIAQTNAPAQRATPVQTEAPDSARDRQDIAADDDMEQPQQPPPPPKSTTAPKPEPEPTRNQERPSKKKSAGKSTRDTDPQPRIRSLHNEARAAASRGDCQTVNEAGTMIKNLDARYYRDSFRKDRAFAACFSAQTQP